GVKVPRQERTTETRGSTETQRGTANVSGVSCAITFRRATLRVLLINYPADSRRSRGSYGELSWLAHDRTHCVALDGGRISFEGHSLAASADDSFMLCGNCLQLFCPGHAFVDGHLLECALCHHQRRSGGDHY